MPWTGFIEVFYSNVLNEIFQLWPFDRLHVLDPYLAARNLDQLLGER